MLVKDIVINACKYLDFDDVISYLNGDIEINDDVRENLNKLLVAVNIANNNIASNYIPIKMVSKVKVNNGKVLFNSFTDKSIIDIYSIKRNGIKYNDYTVVSDGVVISDGEYVIEYSIFPCEVDIDHSIDYYTKINSGIFAQAVTSEFLYLKGYNDDANYWDEKFRIQMKGLLQFKKSITTPKRRWL